MIKLFRNIRQNLLKEGKTTKYFKYAIGEIILVVIGILIALQINNWNESRNNRNIEINILTQLNTDLKANLIEIVEIKKDLVSANESGKKLLNHLDSNNSVTDSLKFWVEHFSDRNIFNNANTTYKNIENSNKNSLTNDSLRLRITLMYERDFENIHKREVILNEEYFPRYSEELNKNFKTSAAKNIGEVNILLAINTPINLEQLRMNEQFKNTLVDVYNFRVLRLTWLSETIIKLSSLIQDVDSEIENLKSLI